MPKRILLVILDGAGEPLEGERKTSMEFADLTLLNWLARNGHTGLMENDLAEHPDSGLSTWVMLGYPMEDYPGRGWLEALGAGLQPKDGEVCMRANFATVEELPAGSNLQTVPAVPKTHLPPRFKIKDRRAGRSTDGLTELAASISKVNIDGVWVRFHRSLGHRGVVTISNSGVSNNITDSDPGIEGVEVPEIKHVTGDENSVRTASVLNKWNLEVYNKLKSHSANRHRELPANFVLLRNASIPAIVKPFQEVHGFRAVCIAASPVVKGISRAMEMTTVDVLGTTGDLRTNLRDKILQALDALRTHDLAILHIKGTDVAGHDRNRQAKAGFLTKVDKEVFGRIREYVDFKKTVVCVTSDHNTDVTTGLHVSGKYPYTIYTDGINKTGAGAFTERAAAATGINNYPRDLMEILMQYR